MKRILVINNFDSFVHNICQYLEEENALVELVDVDKLNLDSITDYDGVVISPGPGTPSDFSNLQRSLELLSKKGSIPVLGVCLGLQAMWEFFGGRLFKLPAPKHGYSGVLHKCNASSNDFLLKGVEQGAIIGRYHSWALCEKENCAMRISSYDESVLEDGKVPMSAFHPSLPFYGLQFHPESCITENGRIYIRNFLELVNEK